MDNSVDLLMADRFIARRYRLGANPFDHPLPMAEHGFSVVIDATGSLPVMNRSIDFARKGGTVLLFGVPPSGKNLEVEAFKIFVKGLTLLSSFTSVRNSFQAIDLLKSGQIRVEPLISHRLPLEDLPHGLHMMESRDPSARKVIIEPNG